jgi:hypothetical protein
MNYGSMTSRCYCCSMMNDWTTRTMNPSYAMTRMMSLSCRPMYVVA